MENLIFDSHAHYEDEAFAGDRDQLLTSLREKGIGFVVDAASSLKTIGEIQKLIKQYDFLYGSVGVHPSDTAELTEEDLKWMKDLCRTEKIVAVGEIGLDYYWKEPEPDIQKKWFEAQLALAGEVKLPVMIHSREAAKDTLDIMKAVHAENLGGVIHCFSYGVEMAREYLNMGFYIGIGGVLTFTNGKKLKEVAEYVPLESIVLETDCPYLAPVPYRGKRNDSTNLSIVAETLAQIKNVSRDEVIRITRENAIRLYGMEEEDYG